MSVSEGSLKLLQTTRRTQPKQSARTCQSGVVHGTTDTESACVVPAAPLMRSTRTKGRKLPGTEPQSTQPGLVQGGRLTNTLACQVAQKSVLNSLSALQGSRKRRRVHREATIWASEDQPRPAQWRCLRLDVVLAAVHQCPPRATAPACASLSSRGADGIYHRAVPPAG